MTDNGPGPQVTVISFGYGQVDDDGHPIAPPTAHATFDVRHHFKDPHVRPGLRTLTGADPAVIVAVTTTPGVERLVRSIAAAARAFLDGPQPGPVTIAVGCVGGRHRSVVIADEVASRLRGLGTPVTVTHRDMHRPVLCRPAA